MKTSQRYFGVVSPDLADSLESRGYDILRRGSVCQVFGPFDGKVGLSKKSFREGIWKAPVRDSFQLYQDTKLVVRKLVPSVREMVQEHQDPFIEVNFIRKLGHGHCLHIVDQHKSESLEIQVSALPSDRVNWLHWRASHWSNSGRVVYDEGVFPYPDVCDWDEDAQHKKAVDALLKVARKWVKGEGR